MSFVLLLFQSFSFPTRTIELLLFQSFSFPTRTIDIICSPTTWHLPGKLPTTTRRSWKRPWLRCQETWTFSTWDTRRCITGFLTKFFGLTSSGVLTVVAHVVNAVAYWKHKVILEYEWRNEFNLTDESQVNKYGDGVLVYGVCVPIFGESIRSIRIW